MVNCWKAKSIIDMLISSQDFYKKGMNYMQDHSINPVIYYKFIPDDNKLYPIDGIVDIQPGLYLISTDGKVFSKLKNRFLKPFKNHMGYLRIGLQTIDGGYKNYSIHRIVGEMFIVNPYPEFYTDIDHIFGDKEDNYYMHLQWCNNNQNKYLASINGQYEHGEDRYNAVYSDDFAEEICRQFEMGISYKEVYRKYCDGSKRDKNTIGSFIYKLYNRRTRRHITSKYNY